METESIGMELLRLSHDAPEELAKALVDGAHAIFWLRGRVGALEDSAEPVRRCGGDCGNITFGQC